ncbi:hypothetical protein LPB140_03325 [Sphingorhabdus lutea]|uniref:histidine kinase n=1 Tax=Sphingorhabdus lutea TaxID=1913578 RepID=A0A1L3JA42_9SPHN|nr:HAMP domain-containing sensor histidine kinase [Sphingorhabdus lutea]APG62005.1 hypothetical protein LPB140_03325 [Sphingorhabdus lutea]
MGVFEALSVKNKEPKSIDLSVDTIISLSEPETQRRLINPVSQLISQIVNFAAVYTVYHVMNDLVPAPNMLIWVIAAIITLFLTTMAQFIVFFIKPHQTELFTLWIKFDRRIAISNEILAMLTIFLLLPFSHESQRIFATAYFVGYIPMTIFADPGNVTMNRIAIILVIGSFTIFLAIYGNEIENILSALVFAYGCFLFYAVGNIHHIIEKSVLAQSKSDQLTKQLELSLKQTAMERDAKTRFIAAASHDLGQPLQAVNLFSEQFANAQDDISRTRAASAVLRAVAATQNILSHMLNHLRLEADSVTPHLQPTNIFNAVQSVVEQYSGFAAKEKYKLKIVGKAVILNTDPTLFERALGNLIQNAITHSGGNKILICCRIRDRAQQIFVVDNGVGIKPEEREIIFEDYYQGSNSRSITAGGFGLGLSSVRRLAFILGGNAFLYPLWKNGAAFCLTLPIKEKRSK